MQRRGMLIGGSLVLALTGLLLFAGPAAAQRYGRGAWGPSYGWNSGYYNGFAPSYWNGYGYGNFGYGYGNQGAYYGYQTFWPQGNYYGYNQAWPQANYYGGYNYPYGMNYGAYDYAYPQNFSGNYNVNPYYSGYYNPGTYPAPTYGGQYASSGRATGYEGAYESSDEGMTNPNAVAINVRVPADAQVWFNDKPTQQRGNFRQFVSPPIQQGRDYTYDIRAEWTDNGKKVDKTKTVTVHAGDRLTLDMLQGKEGTVINNNRSRTGTDVNTNRTNETGRNLDTNRNEINRRNNETNVPPSGADRTRIPNDVVPPTGSRTNPNDFSNAPGPGGATPNINRTNPADTNRSNPTTGATGTNPTGVTPGTSTPATAPTSPPNSRTVAPGSDTTRGSGTNPTGTTNPASGTNRGTTNPGTTNPGTGTGNNPGGSR